MKRKILAAVMAVTTVFVLAGCKDPCPRCGSTDGSSTCTVCLQRQAERNR
jgi:hypothetical protein